MSSDLERFYDLVSDLAVAMMTTRRADGHLESRAMANQKRSAGANLWFVTATDSGKAADLEADPHVNLAYYKDRTREWVSVSGLATLVHDRAKIAELYEDDWKMWFAHDDDPRSGTVEDPRIVLIAVEIHGAVFFELDKPQPVVLYELARGWLTGTQPELGEPIRIEP